MEQKNGANDVSRYCFNQNISGLRPWGKGGQYIGLTTLPPSCADGLEIWEPQPPGTLGACPGLYRDYFTFIRGLRSVICDMHTKTAFMSFNS
jgi:hypothetical protein